MNTKYQALTLIRWPILASLFVWLLLTCFVYADSGRPDPGQTQLSPREILIQAIQERAKKDVELGKQPKSVSELQILFSKKADAIHMHMTDVELIYDKAYQDTKDFQSISDKIQNELYHNPVKWLFLFIIGLIGVSPFFWRRIIAFFKWLAETAYRQIAGYRLFWGISLRRYRKALEQNYHEVKLIFRPERPLQMQDVYVPLRVAGTIDFQIDNFTRPEGGDNTDSISPTDNAVKFSMWKSIKKHEPIDAYKAIQKHKNLVVIGAPGSGKTMLMNHLTLTYAREGLQGFPDKPVPVLLQLNRLNGSEKNLEEHLKEVLERHNFPKGKSFINSFLKSGKLLLLFDGLDEVNTEIRVNVAAQIKDLLQKYPKNRAIVSCRTQVYKDELSTWADQKLEITEFSDQQIQSFLTAWEQDMPEEKSIEQFLSRLRERPQIMAIARNPLLLAMIAYLYTDTEFVLPHSRAEFYDRSTNLLLEQWKQERNKYKVNQKRLVMQDLALFNQKRAKKSEGDRRTIDFKTVLAQISTVLPNLTLKEEDAQPMLDEIVKRSGLLVAVDGGAGYQFTHLTLQEFFAAKELESKQNELLAFFTQDPDAWREVLRLWCGLEHDSTELIRELYKTDPIMAFECLGDAQKVEEGYVKELVNIFKEGLAEAAENVSLARAFALVAADPRERGKDLLEFVQNSLREPESRIAAAEVLTLTNLPEAAKALAECAGYEPQIYPYLIRMGDLAVPALEEYAKQGQSWAMDALQEIGTPQAALILTPLLWNENEAVPYQTAWRLAALLNKPNIEPVLKTFTLSYEQRQAKQIDWIWTPFNEAPDSALPTIAGRIAHLLHTSPSELIPPGPVPDLTPKLVIPLCTVADKDGQHIENKTNKDSELIKKIDLYIDSLASDKSDHISKSEQVSYSEFIEENIDLSNTSSNWQTLFKGLSELLQLKLLRRLIAGFKPIPDKYDWINVLRPSSYTFESSWQARSMYLLLTLLGLVNLWLLTDTFLQSRQLWPWWQNGLTILAGLTIIIGIVLLWIKHKEIELEGITMITFAETLGLGGAFAIVLTHLSGNWLIGIIGIAIAVVAFVPVASAVDSVASADVADVVVVGGGGGGALGTFVAIYNIYNVFIAVGVAAAIAAAVFGVGVAVVVKDDFVESVKTGGIGGGVMSLSFIITGLLFFLPSESIYDIWSWPGVVLFYIGYLGLFISLLWIANRKQRRARNPLHGLLDEQDAAEVRTYRFRLFKPWLPKRRGMRDL
jgi:hypothetical protein